MSSLGFHLIIGGVTILGLAIGTGTMAWRDRDQPMRAGLIRRVNTRAAVIDDTEVQAVRVTDGRLRAVVTLRVRTRMTEAMAETASAA